MFWNIRKKDGTGYKIESENLAVPEIHRSDEEPTEEMEQLGLPEEWLKQK